MLRVASRRISHLRSDSPHFNLLGNLVALRGKEKPTLATITKVKEFPSAAKICQEDQLNSPDRGQLTADKEAKEHPLNVRLSTIREFEVEMVERKQSLNISPPVLDYVFYQQNAPFIDPNTAKKVQLYCNAFQETVESKRDEIQEFYFDQRAQSGFLFTADTLFHDSKKWGLQKAISSVQYKELYDQQVMMEFAMFWWITYGSGKNSFRHIKSQNENTPYGMKQTTQYPLMFTSLPPRTQKSTATERMYTVIILGYTDSPLQQNQKLRMTNRQALKETCSQWII